jgi:predicted aminopeptidase
MLTLVRSSLVVMALATASGCALPYYWQAASGHFDLLRKRTPIETVLADPQQPPDIKQALRLVLDMRRFAVATLDLPDNRSYRSYVDLQRPYVVWNVVAAEEFAVAPVQWCFAIVGCVSYRGYFAREAAEQFAVSLQAQSMDTFVAGATAYSTLGYFADPVLNTMLTGGEHYVAGILFHELAHQKYYIRGDSDLNEAFASAVQQYGTLAWLAERGSAQAIAAYRAALGRQADFAALLATQRARLAALYASPLEFQAMRSAKVAAFAQLREDYAALKRSWGGVSEYDAWFSEPLNNAQLASVATYRRWLPALSWYLDEYGLAALYTQMEALENLSAAARERQLQTWLDLAAAANPVVSGG